MIFNFCLDPRNYEIMPRFPIEMSNICYTSGPFVLQKEDTKRPFRNKNEVRNGVLDIIVTGLPANSRRFLASAGSSPELLYSLPP